MRDALAGRPAAVVALQRAAGNRAVAAVLGPGRRARTLARFTHQNCSEDDLKAYVWPSDHIAREMVKKAIKALSAETIDPAVRTLLGHYFMTTTPKLGSILAVYDKLDAEFRANDYTYECEDEADNARCLRIPDSPTMAKAAHGYTWGGFLGGLTQAHIHLCMNTVRDKDNACVASTMIHEMSHRYVDTDDHAYCNFCNDDDCPQGLSPDDALDNADSYSAFAYKLWPMTVLMASVDDEDPGGNGDEPETATA